MNQHTFIIETAHEPGELARIAGIFAGRGLNIERMSLAPLADNRFAEIRILSAVAEPTLRQLIKQLKKLVRVRLVEVSQVEFESF